MSEKTHDESSPQLNEKAKTSPRSPQKKLHASIATGTADPRKSYVERMVTPTRRRLSPPPTEDESSCIIIASGTKPLSRPISASRTTLSPRRTIHGGCLGDGHCDLDSLAAERHARIHSEVHSPGGIVDRKLTPSCSRSCSPLGPKRASHHEATKSEGTHAVDDTESVVEKYGLFPLGVLVALFGIITTRSA